MKYYNFESFGFVSPHAHTALSLSVFFFFLYSLKLAWKIDSSLHDPKTIAHEMCDTKIDKYNSNVNYCSICLHIFSFSASLSFRSNSVSFVSVHSSFTFSAFISIRFFVVVVERCNASHFAIFDSLLSLEKWRVFTIETGTRSQSKPINFK